MSSPADYSSTGQALSLPTSTLRSSSPSSLASSPNSESPSPSPSPSPSSFPSLLHNNNNNKHSRNGSNHHSHSNGGGGKGMPVPPWARASPIAASTAARQLSNSSSSGGPGRPPAPSSINSRRLSNPYGRVPRRAPLGRRVAAWSLGALNQTVRLAASMNRTQQILAAVAGAVSITLLVLFTVYSHRIFAWLAPVAEGWRALPGGWILVFLMTCATGFPPLIGYSTSLTIAGFVYGFPGGWPIVASATVLGSTAAFAASRTVLSGYVHRLVGSDRRFVALGHVLRHDGLLVLAGLRFCPLPFSLSNGFLATVPSVSPWSFALATALSTPKLLVHVFIGSRLARLAESGDQMTIGDKVINYLSMLLGLLVGMGVGLLVYRRTMARAEQLAREDLEAAAATATTTAAAGSVAGAGAGAAIAAFEYDDGPEDELDHGILASRQLLDESDDADAAALMSEDDISLWARDEGMGVFEDADGGGDGDAGQELVEGSYRDRDGDDNGDDDADGVISDSPAGALDRGRYHDDVADDDVDVDNPR